MTSDFRVIDLTVNNWVNSIMIDKFNKWCAEISIKLKLITMKPLHAQWIIDAYNQLSSFEIKKIKISWMETFRNIR